MQFLLNLYHAHLSEVYRRKADECLVSNTALSLQLGVVSRMHARQVVYR